MVPWSAAAALLVVGAHAAWYDTFTGNQITEERAADVKLNNLVPYCAIEVKDCDPHERRRLDYTCNNLHHPTRGATLTPYHRMLPPDYAADGGLRTAKSGRPLPNARSLRVALMSDGRVPSEHFTAMITNMNLLIVSDSTSVHDTINYVAVTRTCCLPGGDKDPRCIPIKVPEDDLHLRRSNVRCMNLTRAITYQRLGCVPRTVPGERVNTSPPMLDLSNVYGATEKLSRRAREGAGGRLRSDLIKGKEWPASGSPICLNNEPERNETRCHQATPGNFLIGLNLAFIWLYRNHNHIAGKLQDLNPCWDDDQIYTTAKDINIAQYQHFIYYELMPNILGTEYLVKNKVIFPDHLHVDDYDETLEPRVSLEYVQGIRWFHSLQEGRLNLYDKQGKIFGQLAAVDLTLRTGILPNNNTIEGITQGVFRQPTASNEYVIDPDMGERVLGPLQFASDVMSADIMKGRDVGVPSYNRYRCLCRLPQAKDFHDLYDWMPEAQVEAITAAYEDVDDIDLMVGIIGERPMPGAVMGPTLACLLTEQLLRWRRADRFWHENTEHPGAFTREQLHEIKKTTTAKILCDHGDSVSAIQPNVYRLPGHGNEIKPCTHYEPLDYTVWRDPQCYHGQHHSPGPWYHQ